MKKYDVIIIGSGIAGISASIYLKRSNKSVLIIESNVVGGQLNRSSIIENYPGYTSIDGPSLAYNLYNQVNNLGIEYLYEEVTSVDFNKNIVNTSNSNIEYKYLIIATGRSHRKLDILNDYVGKGVSYCALCDSHLYKDKDVVVVGGGNTAFESVLYLASIAKKVYLVHRRDEFRGDEISLDAIKKKDNVEIITNSKITRINESDNKISSVIINDDREIDCSCLFVCVGNVPIPIKCNNLETNNNYVIVDKYMETSVPGIYAAGDIIDKDVYQISTSVGEGTICAMSIIRGK